MGNIVILDNIYIYRYANASVKLYSKVAIYVENGISLFLLANFYYFQNVIIIIIISARFVANLQANP